MTGIEQLRVAATKSQEIIARFNGLADAEPDVLAARAKELEAMTKAQLIELIGTLEKVKVEKAFKVEDIVQAILEEPACGVFNYEQIAALVHQVLPDSKTSAKSVASYASKRKEDWTIVPRTRINFSHADLLKMAVNE